MQAEKGAGAHGGDEVSVSVSGGPVLPQTLFSRRHSGGAGRGGTETANGCNDDVVAKELVNLWAQAMVFHGGASNAQTVYTFA